MINLSAGCLICEAPLRERLPAYPESILINQLNHAFERCLGRRDADRWDCAKKSIDWTKARTKFRSECRRISDVAMRDSHAKNFANEDSFVRDVSRCHCKRSSKNKIAGPAGWDGELEELASRPGLRDGKAGMLVPPSPPLAVWSRRIPQTKRPTGRTVRDQGARDSWVAK